MLQDAMHAGSLKRDQKASFWQIYLTNVQLTRCIPSGWKSEYVNPYIPTQSPGEDWSDHRQNYQADSPLYVWPDVWSADLHLLIKSMVIHDTECPYWDQVSLNNTNHDQMQPLPLTGSIIWVLDVGGEGYTIHTIQSSVYGVTPSPWIPLPQHPTPKY